MPEPGKTRQPVWRPRARVSLATLPPPLRAWLFDNDSLTQRLIAASHGAFAVAVLAQGRARPLPGERATLKMRLGEAGFLRQVHLLCYGEPWVYARTVIPPRALSGARRRLVRLGGRSLGQVLFADSRTVRGEVEVAQLFPGHTAFDLATRHLTMKPASLWGRRSVFWLGGAPLLVSEFFLPALARAQKLDGEV